MESTVRRRSEILYILGLTPRDFSKELEKERARSPLSRWFFGDSIASLDSRLDVTAAEMPRMEKDAIGLAGEISELQVYLSGLRVNVAASLEQLRANAARG